MSLNVTVNMPCDLAVEDRNRGPEWWTPVRHHRSKATKAQESAATSAMTVAENRTIGQLGRWNPRLSWTTLNRHIIGDVKKQYLKAQRAERNRQALRQLCS